jgi:MoxR-like ATPase
LTSLETTDLDRYAEVAAEIESAVGRRIAGQRELIRQTMVGLLAEGHVLLEGVPGLGKTELVKAFSEALGLQFSRVQFTPDLMPADIVGTQVLEESESGHRRFEYQAGPVFTNLLLADEINRATPKTQAALLEAMQERHVTVAGFSFSPPRTRSNWKAPTPFPRRSSTGSCSRPLSAHPRQRFSRKSSGAPPAEWCRKYLWWRTWRPSGR